MVENTQKQEPGVEQEVNQEQKEKPEAEKQEEKKEAKKKEEKKEAEQEEKKEAEKQEEKKEAKKKEEKKEAEQEEKKELSVEIGDKEAGIIGSIESLSVIELANLVKALEEKFGVTASMPIMGMVASAGAGAGQTAPEAEEKTTFDVVLSEIGNNKIQVIKEVRTVTSLGLKEAKDLVESAPKPVVSGVKKEEAEEVKKKLETVGAKVELK